MVAMAEIVVSDLVVGARHRRTAAATRCCVAAELGVPTRTPASYARATWADRFPGSASLRSADRAEASVREPVARRMRAISEGPSIDAVVPGWAARQKRNDHLAVRASVLRRAGNSPCATRRLAHAAGSGCYWSDEDRPAEHRRGR